MNEVHAEQSVVDFPLLPLLTSPELKAASTDDLMASATFTSAFLMTVLFPASSNCVRMSPAILWPFLRASEAASTSDFECYCCMNPERTPMARIRKAMDHAV
jgi:hypothetical protein